LVRTHKFLSRLGEIHKKLGHEEKNTANTDGDKAQSSDKVLHLDLPETDMNKMLKIADAQLSRIQENIQNIIRFLVRALLKPDSRTPMMPDSHVPGESNYYYVMTTIWYVTRNFPKWTWDWEASIVKWEGKGHLFDSERLPLDNWTFGTSEKERVPLLQWYHCGSILGLCQQGILPENWKDEGLEEKVSRLAKAAKIFAAAKLSCRQPYSADDEIIDRLSFLSDELGLEPRGRGRIGTVASLCMKRVKRRDNTRDLNPGWLPHRDKGPTSGPWEIHALCHHSRLVVLSLEEKDSQDWRTKEHTKEEIESYKWKIYRFLNADGTLIPCWERAHAKAREGWLRSEATAVLASTLLIINEKDMKDGLFASGATDVDTERGSGDASHTEQAHTEQVVTKQAHTVKARKKQANKEQARKAQALVEQAQMDQRKLLLEILYMESLMKDQLEVLEKFTGEAGRLPPIKWTTFSPPRRYHPESFCNSLEDTPDLYGEFNYSYLLQFMESLRIFDITATGPDQDAEGFTWEIIPYKYDCWDSKKFEELSEQVKDLSKQEDDLSKQEGDLSKQKDDLLKKKNDKEKEKDELNKRKDELCWGLYDSVSKIHAVIAVIFVFFHANALRQLVDQEVQHRFL
jgi:hypothetical protein